MSVVLTDGSFAHLVTMHHYAERVMSLTHSEPYGPRVVLRTDEKEDRALMHFNVLISGRVCASEEGADPRDGIERIADERMRQFNDLGWSAEHDDDHDRGELSYAAALLAEPPWERQPDVVKEMWPWETGAPTIGKFSERNQPDNVKLRIRELEKAGALCAAEIDRLERLEGLDDGG